MAVGGTLVLPQVVPLAHKLVSSSQTVPLASARLKFIMAVEVVAGAVNEKEYFVQAVLRFATWLVYSV